ncbi:thioredoxin family protein [uncultured Alistipes sp.]|jgi:hypothetical protein|uniref:thioredoxin family protein n=1 Tax=uncultured Alistipes sp. TaxID=538949 RepID=UPI0025CC706F|nr:thioredoxin family protein [uncultured Alistipes sp.]
MKKILLLVFLTLGAVSAVSAQTRFEELSFAEAKALAAKTDKLLFVDIYTSWCGPCVEMTRDVFPRKDVGEYMNARFICVKYDGEKDADGVALVKDYGIKSVPTFLVFDASGKLVDRAVGGMEAADFLKSISRIAAKAGKSD